MKRLISWFRTKIIETGRYEMDFSQWKELKKGEKIELKIDAAGFAEVNQK